MSLIALLAFASVWAIGFGLRASALADSRRRERGRWFVFGAVLGPAALAILAAAPPGTCGSCLTPVAGWSLTCHVCGEDVRAVPRLLRLMQSDVRVPNAAGRPVDMLPAASPVASTADWVSPAMIASWRPGIAQRVIPATALGDRAPVPVGPGPLRVTTVASRTATPGLPVRHEPGPFEAAMAAAIRPVAHADNIPSHEPAPAPEVVPEAAPDIPVPLAAAVFVEGSRSLSPGSRYRLAAHGHELLIGRSEASTTDQHEVLSEPIDQVRVSVRGGRMLVSGTSDALADLRLVFTETEDLTGHGVAREVNAMRRAMDAASPAGAGS